MREHTLATLNAAFALNNQFFVSFCQFVRLGSRYKIINPLLLVTKLPKVKQGHKTQRNNEPTQHETYATSTLKLIFYDRGLGSLRKLHINAFTGGCVIGAAGLSFERVACIRSLFAVLTTWANKKYTPVSQLKSAQLIFCSRVPFGLNTRLRYRCSLPITKTLLSNNQPVKSQK